MALCKQGLQLCNWLDPGYFCTEPYWNLWGLSGVYRPYAFLVTERLIRKLAACSAGADWWPHNSCREKRAASHKSRVAVWATEPAITDWWEATQETSRFSGREEQSVSLGNNLQKRCGGSSKSVQETDSNCFRLYWNPEEWAGLGSPADPARGVFKVCKEKVVQTPRDQRLWTVAN